MLAHNEPFKLLLQWGSNRPTACPTPTAREMFLTLNRIHSGSGEQGKMNPRKEAELPAWGKITNICTYLCVHPRTKRCHHLRQKTKPAENSQTVRAIRNKRLNKRIFLSSNNKGIAFSTALRQKENLQIKLSWNPFRLSHQHCAGFAGKKGLINGSPRFSCFCLLWIDSQVQV